MNIHNSKDYCEFALHVIFRGIEAGYTRPQDWLMHSVQPKEQLYLPLYIRKKRDKYYHLLVRELFYAKNGSFPSSDEDMITWLNSATKDLDEQRLTTNGEQLGEITQEEIICKQEEETSKES